MRAALVAAAALAGCVIPPGPRSTPASGVAGQARAGMKSPRVKGESPFKDAYFGVAIDSNALRTAAEWRKSHPEDAAAMDKLASQPTAAWMGNWNPVIEHDVQAYVWSRTGNGSLPVMVLYNLPFRDCGLHSRGGAGSVAGYRKWIDGVARAASAGGARCSCWSPTVCRR